MCRAVEAKQNLPEWCRKRYNALAASLQIAPDPSISLNLTESGKCVNILASQRPALKKAVYYLIKGQYMEDSHLNIPIKAQVRMLVAYSEMTTYTLINRVIDYGGPILILPPLPAQIIKFSEEKRVIEEKLKKDGFPITDIEFLHLIYKNHQCFTAASYPDMIIVAQQIEIHLNPEQGKTIKNYKANISGARINRNTVKQLINAKEQAGSMMMTKEEEEKLNALGINVKELRETAKRVLSAVARRKRMEPSSDEDD